MSSTTPTPNDLTRQQLDELDALLQRMLSLPLSAPAASPPTPAPVPQVQPAPSVSLPAGWRSDAPTATATRPPYFSVGTIEEAEELLEQAAAMTVPLMAATAAPPAPPTPAPSPPFPVQNLSDSRLFAPPMPEPTVPPAAGPLRGVDAPALPFGYRPPADPPLTPAPVPTPPPQTQAYPDEEPLAELTPVTPAPATSKVVAETTQRSGVPVPLWPLFAVNWVLELLLGLLGPVGTATTNPAMKHLLGIAGLGLLAGAGAWAARGMGWVEW
jgi:hypothetical protein